MVFGGGGQVECHLIELAFATSRDLVGLTHAEADICDADAVGAAIAKHSPTSIVSAAAYTVVDKAESETDRAFQVNRDGASVVAEPRPKRISRSFICRPTTCSTVRAGYLTGKTTRSIRKGAMPQAKRPASVPLEAPMTGT
jgi:nucleoside-diphosphate-sugar epimerase